MGELSKGVIEGFYGKTWSWPQRRDMVDFLADHGFGSYWYAPKADPFLRRQWAEPWPEDMFAELQSLAAYCVARGIRFGVGLSPLGLYQQWRNGSTGQELLLNRLQQIGRLQPGGLALLFDDMQGDLPLLAVTQSEIAHVAAASMLFEQLVLCPSYYSHDPILEQLFGRMPANYWADLGMLLDSKIDIFWTGDKVISNDYPSDGLDAITELFRRKPLLWDNSIVNDGRKTSPFLPVRAMFDTSQFECSVSGLVINPMNPPALAQIPLLTLLLQGSPDQRLQQAITELAPELMEGIQDCLPLFACKGRDALEASDRAMLEHYFRASGHPVARDIMNWLDGVYRFDPACLT